MNRLCLRSRAIRVNDECLIVHENHLRAGLKTKVGFFCAVFLKWFEMIWRLVRFFLKALLRCQLSRILSFLKLVLRVVCTANMTVISALTVSLRAQWRFHACLLHFNLTKPVCSKSSISLLVQLLLRLLHWDASAWKLAWCIDWTTWSSLRLYVVECQLLSAIDFHKLSGDLVRGRGFLCAFHPIHAKSRFRHLN